MHTPIAETPNSLAERSIEDFGDFFQSSHQGEAGGLLPLKAQGTEDCPLLGVSPSLRPPRLSRLQNTLPNIRRMCPENSLVPQTVPRIHERPNGCFALANARQHPRKRRKPVKTRDRNDLQGLKTIRIILSDVLILRFAVRGAPQRRGAIASKEGLIQ